MNKPVVALNLLLQGKEIKLQNGSIIRLFKPGETIPVANLGDYETTDKFWLGLHTTNLKGEFIGYIGLEELTLAGFCKEAELLPASCLMQESTNV
jgi:hypothetical protein